MTEEQQKFIIDKINNGWSYTKISKQLGIDRRKISNWCINNNCISSKAKNKKSISDNWTDERIEQFKKMYTEIKYDVYVYTYNDILTEFKEISDRSTVQYIANRYGLVRDEKYMEKGKSLTYTQREKIIEDNKILNITEISKKIKVNERTISNFLKSQGIKPNRANPKYKKEIMLNNEDFKKDYENLLLSPTYISSKWDIDHKTIQIWRKQDYGDYTHRVNGALARTRPEQEFEDILFNLEIPYFYQWQIDNWTIDYYLGNKICVEINGVYWHSIDKTLEKDERKLSDLKDKGYTVINFTEYEIYNEKNKVIQIIKEHAALR